MTNSSTTTVVIRRAKVDDIPAIVHCHIETWKAAFVPIMTPEQFALKDLDSTSQTHIWQRRLQTEENHTRYTFIALLEGQFAGYCTGVKYTGKPDSYASELHQIYVLPAAQGHGIGRKLVNALAAELLESGYTSMLVWVMTLNPAVAFYRDALGGEYLTERIITDADGVLKEAAYGWPDLTRLAR